ncbi:MAG: tetratricopeptide repeat protein [Ktedonobacteraceae bacterium]
MVSEKTLGNHIFISYAWLDSADWVRKLHIDLTDQGLRVWLDIYDIPPGSDWNEEIDRALESAKVLIVIMTPGSTLSIQVRGEWNYALNRLIPVIPILLKPCDIPRTLNTLNYIDFTSDHQQAFAKLIQRLHDLDSDHILHLKTLRDAFLEVQGEAEVPSRFQGKIDQITQAMGGWTDRVERQTVRVSSGLSRERENSLREKTQRTKSVLTQRIVGPHIQDVTDHFKDRLPDLAEVSRNLARKSCRVVSIVGRGGIGKTALASKILAELEQNRWLHANEPIKVDGIIYLSTHVGSGITLENIFLKCSRMLGDDSIEAIWKDTHIQTYDKIDYLLGHLEFGFYILFLDNFEDLLNNENQLLDNSLELFMNMVLNISNGLKILITSREVLKLDLSVQRCAYQLTLREGLPLQDSIEFLREMDPQGEYGLAKLTESELGEIVLLVHGVPRALQLFASILANDPFSNITKLKETFYDVSDVVEKLAKENYRRLDDASRMVSLALTIYRRPVSTLAVDYLLEPFFPGLDVPSIVRRLTRAQTVSVDRVSGLVALHPIDRDYISSHYNNQQELIQNLEKRASEYYHSQRTPKDTWQSLEDIRTVLYEIEHLQNAKLFEEASAILDEIDADYLEMWGYYERLIQMRTNLPQALSETCIIRNKLRLSRIFSLIGQLTPSADYANQAIELAQNREEVALESEALGEIAGVHRDIGEYEKAIAAFQKALDLAQKVDYKELIGSHLIGLGRTHRTLGHIDRAIECFETALQIYQKTESTTVNTPIKRQYLLALIMDSIGLSYRARGQFLQARGYYEQGLIISHSIGDRGGKAYRLSNLGSAYRTMGDMRMAQKLYGEALDIYLEIKDRWGEGCVRRNKGLALAETGEYHNALIESQVALEISHEVGNLQGEGNTLLNMGYIYRRKGNYNKAIQYGEQAYNLFRQIGSPYYQSFATLDLSWSLLFAGHQADAQRFIDETLNSGIDVNIYSGMYLSALVKLIKKQVAESSVTFKQAEQKVMNLIALTDKNYRAQYIKALISLAFVWCIPHSSVEIARLQFSTARQNCDATGVLAFYRQNLDFYTDVIEPSVLNNIREMLI